MTLLIQVEFQVLGKRVRDTVCDLLEEFASRSSDEGILIMEADQSDNMMLDLTSELTHESRRRLNDLAQYRRKSDILIFGVKEETDEDLIQVVAGIISRKLMMALLVEEIKDTYRIGSRNAERPRGIIVRFFCRATRDKVLRARKALKGTGVSFHENLTKDNVLLLKEVRNHSDIDMAWSWNGNIFGRLVNNLTKILRFCLGDNINDIIEMNREP